MTMLYNRYLYIFLSLLTQGLFAQFEPDSKNDTLAEKSKFRIALAYASDYYFMGRVDSVRAPYLTPSLAYYHKSGLFIKTSLSYLHDSGFLERESRLSVLTKKCTVAILFSKRCSNSFNSTESNLLGCQSVSNC